MIQKRKIQLNFGIFFSAVRPLCDALQVLDIVRAAESLALGTHLSDASSGTGAPSVGHPPKSPVEHEDKMHKTTTIVMSAHTLDTQPQVCFFLCLFYFYFVADPHLNHCKCATLLFIIVIFSQRIFLLRGFCCGCRFVHTHTHNYNSVRFTFSI